MDRKIAKICIHLKPKKTILKDIAKQVQLQFLEANYTAIELLLAKAKEKRRM